MIHHQYTIITKYLEVIVKKLHKGLQTLNVYWHYLMGSIEKKP